jgi:hypothetical protein
VPHLISPPELTDDALRNILLDYRRKKIEPSLQDLNRSILADELLNKFVKNRPTTHEEFLKFPFFLRDKIESGQGEFLDEILEIVKEFTI